MVEIENHKRPQIHTVRENSVRENPNIKVEHISSGKINPADMFSKEDKDVTHYQYLCNKTVKKPFQSKKVRFCEHRIIRTFEKDWNSTQSSHQYSLPLDKGGIVLMLIHTRRNNLRTYSPMT